MYNKNTMVGIYKITNPKGKSYIGLSREIETRWNSYRHMQFQSNTLLKESFNQYGPTNHIFEVIEEIPLEENTYGKNTAVLRKRERYWINLYKTFENGLNQNGGGSGCNAHTTESKQKISESLKGKPKPPDFGAKRKKWQHTEEFKEKVRNSPRCPILMYDLEDNLIQEFPTQQHAADYLGVRKQTIWNFLNGYISLKGKSKRIHIKGFKFSYKV
jgi:group I intron endonuclease